MRAICEQCEAVQPPTWTAGDLCTTCGQSVRHEVRCFWCATWTPAAAFCRTCGADVIDERLYGAARMLKDAGTDRFSVPERLYALDAARVENFTRIYQRHAVVAARHVDELAALEQCLHHRHWSAALDDELATQLPWPLDLLEQHTAAGPSTPIDPAAPVDAARARAIHDATPFPVVRSVAALALVQLGDLGVVDEVRSLLHDGDAMVRCEAALVLSSWRSRTVLDLRGEARDIERALEACAAFRHAADVRLAALRGTLETLPPADVLAGDPEALFDAALQRGDVDRLGAALADIDDPTTCVAAARSLVRAGAIGALERPLRDGRDEVRDEIVDALSRSKLTCVELHGPLVEVACTAPDGRLRRTATRVAARSLTHESAMRIATAAHDGTIDSFDASAIVQSLLQCELASSETVVAIADLLLGRGTYSSQQYGLATVADDGRLPDAFVPKRFGGADDAARRELLGTAERQLGQRGDDELHRFVLLVLFDDHPVATRSAAMWALRRWYKLQGDHRGEGPLVLHLDAVERWFGSIDRLVRGLCSMLRDDATMREVGVFEYLANLLRTADDALVGALQADRSGLPLVEALAEAAQRDYWPGTLEAIWTLLSRLGTRPDWTSIAVDALHRVGRAGNYHFDKALERLSVAS